MGAYVVRRILATIPVVFVVAFFVFSLLYLAPGDPAVLIAGDHATAEEIARIRLVLGLEQPFLIRFKDWLFQILCGDLGTSIFSSVPVAHLILQRVEPTISLLCLTLLISISFALPIGVVAAARHGTWLDRSVMMFSVLGFSVPVFVVGYALAYFFGVYLEWLPVQGFKPISTGVEAFLGSLMLPAAALGAAYAALIARMVRAAMLDVLTQDYIKAAKAKGVGNLKLLYVHALKNAAVPIVTIIGIGVATLIGGAVVTETVFAIPGLGRLTVDAILQRDYPVIQGTVLLFSFSYVLVNLLVDLLYVLFDPRIRY